MAQLRKRLALILALSVIIGCASMSHLSSADKAANVGMELSRYYQFMYDQATKMYAAGNEETRTLLRKEINPKLNQAKRTLVSYLDIVAAWKSGDMVGNPEASLAEREQVIRGLLESALQLLPLPMSTEEFPGRVTYD